MPAAREFIVCVEDSGTFFSGKRKIILSAATVDEMMEGMRDKFQILRPFSLQYMDADFKEFFSVYDLDSIKTTALRMRLVELETPGEQTSSNEQQDTKRQRTSEPAPHAPHEHTPRGKQDQAEGDKLRKREQQPVQEPQPQQMQQGSLLPDSPPPRQSRMLSAGTGGRENVD